MSRCGPARRRARGARPRRCGRGSPPTSCSCVAGANPRATGSTVNVRGAAVVVEGEHGRRAGRRQLVEPAAVDDPRVGRAVGPQRGQHPLGEVGVGDADHLAAHPARVGHRTEQVEHGRDADLAARRGGEAERRMEPRREAEPDPGLLDAAPHAVRRQLDRHAERLEHVGRAALRRRPAGAVLAHRHAGAGDHEGGHRRHVDRVRAVAAGADDVDGRIAQLVAERDQLGGASTASSNPDSSSAVSPLIRSATTKAISWAGVAPPDRIVAIAVAPGRRSGRALEQVGEHARPPAVDASSSMLDGASDQPGRSRDANLFSARTRRGCRVEGVRRAAALADDPAALPLGAARPRRRPSPGASGRARGRRPAPRTSHTALASTASSSSSGRRCCVEPPTGPNLRHSMSCSDTMRIPHPGGLCARTIEPPIRRRSRGNLGTPRRELAEARISWSLRGDARA